MSMFINQEAINTITQTFSPGIEFETLRQMAAQSVEIKSDGLYALLDTLASQCKPSVQDKYESKWNYWYLPVEHNGELVCTAISLFLSYKKTYVLAWNDISRYTGTTVDKGPQEVPQEYAQIIDEISRFMPLAETHGDGTFGVVVEQ